MPIARLQDLRLELGRTPVLTGVSLHLDEGERLGVVGPNGAGKTTLLSVLATLRRPTGGDGEVLGARLGSDAVLAVRRQIGWSGHSPALYDDLTLGENLAHIARLTGLDPGHAEKALHAVGMGAAADRRAGAASNGMRRRVDLARLLLTSPRLVLLDEAQAGLDADAMVIVEEVCRRAVRGPGAVVMVSHDERLLEQRVDRVLRLVDGRLRG